MSSEKFKNKYRVPTARLKGWDYSSDGWYFVTICTDDRVCYFGDVVDGEMGLSGVGKIAEQELLKTEQMRDNVKLDAWVVMPNHVHAIIVIGNRGWGGGSGGFVGGRGGFVGGSCGFVETQCIASLQKNNAIQKNNNEPRPWRKYQSNKFGPQINNLPSIVRGFKIGVSKWATINSIPFSWQPRYHDAIIRTPESLERIRHYIRKNPANWKTDRNNLEGLYM